MEAGAGGARRVVIVGGGFGGLYAARALSRAPVEITLVDRRNHHLFQPLLYQVATGILSEGEIAPPLRWVLRNQPNARVLLAEVAGFDLERRVVLARASDGEALELPYDALVVAAGSTDSYFGHDEWAEHAPGLKSLADARELRNRVLRAFELAEDAHDEAERAALLTFVLVGAGPSGVEMAGQIAQYGNETLRREFRSIGADGARIVMVEGSPAVLHAFAPELGRRAARDLERLGVEIRLETRAVALDDRGVEVEGPDGTRERIEARTVIWAAGVAASPLARKLGEATGAEVDRAGRVSVEHDFSLPEHPEVFCIGDMASKDDLPGVAQPAMQAGRYVAGVIEARFSGWAAPGPFKYFDKGSLAVIGRRKAVADVFGIKVGGFPAWTIWGFVHVLYLVGWGNRVGTVGRWAGIILTRQRRERVIDAVPPPP